MAEGGSTWGAADRQPRVSMSSPREELGRRVRMIFTRYALLLRIALWAFYARRGAALLEGKVTPKSFRALVIPPAKPVLFGWRARECAWKLWPSAPPTRVMQYYATAA